MSAEIATEFDDYRDTIIEYVNTHRSQLQGVLRCPIKDDEKGCYQCSDAMVTVCMLVNERKIGG